jgi:hypothetical protein
MLIDYKKQIEILDKIRNGKIREGLKLDIEGIDEHIRFKPNNFNLILGHANVGKTTTILYLMLCYSLKHDIKWLICSTENESYSLIRKLVEFLDETPMNLISEHNYKEHLKFVNAHFKFVDNTRMYDYKEALTMFRDVLNDYKYDGILLDPYNALVKNNDLMKTLGGHEYDYQACTEMRMFCKDNKKTLWLNTHANTQALRMIHRYDHEYAGLPIPPMASDVEGGGKFVNRADDFFVIHRYIEHPSKWNVTLIYVKKVKEMETGGKQTSIDKPIEFVSHRSAVGFTYLGKSILQLIKESQLNYL